MFLPRITDTTFNRCEGDWSIYKNNQYQKLSTDDITSGAMHQYHMNENVMATSHPSGGKIRVVVFFKPLFHQVEA